MRRSRACAVTALPEPDSPTTPRISRGRTEKLTLSTASTRPSSVAKCTVRLSTDRKSTRLNSSHDQISYAVFCLKKKKKKLKDYLRRVAIAFHHAFDSIFQQDDWEVDKQTHGN